MDLFKTCKELDLDVFPVYIFILLVSIDVPLLEKYIFTFNNGSFLRQMLLLLLFTFVNLSHALKYFFSHNKIVVY